MQHQQQTLRQADLLMHEKILFARGFKQIAGLDEAGRGPLAGPVVACACIIEEGIEFPGINDSKLLTELARERFYEVLTTHPGVKYGVGIVDAKMIDKINIFQATKVAMKKALKALTILPDYLLIDAVKLSYKRIPFENLIEGDRKSQSIAAASIVAKVVRDRKMVGYHKKFRKYGFHEHKGYGTKKHLEALALYGPTPIHRRSFSPVTIAELEREAELQESGLHHD
jgi:ribonuclease HII